MDSANINNNDTAVAGTAPVSPAPSDTGSKNGGKKAPAAATTTQQNKNLPIPTLLWQTWNKVATKMTSSSSLRKAMTIDTKAASAAAAAGTASGGSGNGKIDKLAFDQEFTGRVIAATGPNANPRMAEIMPSLLRHLHDFAREVNLTAAEWAAAVDFVNAAGKMSDSARNENALICDILGLESLVDEITSKLLIQGSKNGATPATPSTVLGPFYRTDAPILPNDSSIVSADAFKLWDGKGDDMTCHVTGRVLSAATGNPICGAMVDIWLAGPDGLYEQQSAEVPDMNLRGRFQTDAEGRYGIYCLRPTPYGIPDDGPGGALLKLLDRHPWRPAHIHFIVSAPAHSALTTQVFDREGEWIKNDSVFAVKEELLVDFKAREGDDKAKWSLEYDFVLPEI